MFSVIERIEMARRDGAASSELLDELRAYVEIVHGAAGILSHLDDLVPRACEKIVLGGIAFCHLTPVGIPLQARRLRARVEALRAIYNSKDGNREEAL